MNLRRSSSTFYINLFTTGGTAQSFGTVGWNLLGSVNRVSALARAASSSNSCAAARSPSKPPAASTSISLRVQRTQPTWFWTRRNVALDRGWVRRSAAEQADPAQVWSANRRFIMEHAVAEELSIILAGGAREHGGIHWVSGVYPVPGVCSRLPLVHLSETLDRAAAVRIGL